MLISCEKCSTTYVLDDALIPPQGAPVQCTKCGHVFTARVAAFEATPEPEPRPGNSTLVFGHTSAALPANKNQTMMFGTAGSNAAPPPAAAPAPAPPGNPRSTMMFGTPASIAAGAQGPTPEPVASPKATMVFGGGAPAPAASKNQTMMFGTPASAGIPAAPPPAAPPPANKNQTMMFGTPATAGVPAPKADPNPPAGGIRTTMMFGAPGGPGAPAPAAPPAPTSGKSSQTMVFGTAASQAAAKEPAPHAPAAGKHTLVFGANAVAPAKQTMVFGTAASNAQLDDSPVDETILERPGQSSRTVIFGTGAPAAEPEAPTPRGGQTMMFGKAAPTPRVTADEPESGGEPPSESTVRVDLNDFLASQQGGGARAERTQRFAMSDAGSKTPPAGLDPVADRQNRTQLFAMTTPQSGSDSVVLEDTTLAPSSPAARRPDLAATLPADQPPMVLAGKRSGDPAGVSVLHDPDAPAGEVTRTGQGDRPFATTLPHLEPANPGRPLPPLRVEQSVEQSGDDLPASPDLQQDDEAAMRAARSGGAGRAVVIVLAVVALILLGVLVYRLFGAQLMGATAAPVGVVPSVREVLGSALG